MREIFHRWWSAQKQFLHSKDALVYLSFVLLSTVIWLVHAFNTRRTVTMQVPVTYENVPDNYIFDSGLHSFLRVTVEDEGVDLFHSRDRSLSLSFDVSGMIRGEHGVLELTADDLRQALMQHLAGDAALVSFTPEELTASYTRQREKKVPVVYRGQVQPAPQYQLCGQPEVIPDHIHVYGTKEALREVDSVYTVLTDYEGVQDSFLTTLALLPVEGVRFLRDSVRMLIVTERFTDKALTLPICIPHDGDTTHVVHLFPNQVQVTFRIGTPYFNSVSEADMRAYVELPKKVTDRLPVRIRCNNPHITHLRVKPEEVEYLIESR